MASSYVLVAATAIFLATYVLISLRTIRRFPIERPAVAMLGAALMIAFGVVCPLEAIWAINLEVLVLRLGMMILVAGLDVFGFFHAVSLAIARRARTQGGRERDRRPDREPAGR